MKQQSEDALTELGETIDPMIQGAVSNMNDFSTDVGEEHVEQFIKEKRRVNMHVAVNRLPIELLTYIFLLAKEEKNKQPYISYTWVCYHWRWVLIHNPVFWTLIRHPRRYRHPRHSQTFDVELFRRSEPVKLDLILSEASRMSTFKELFAKESDRIRSLWIPENNKKLIGLVLSGNRFPSLRGLAIHQTYGTHNTLTSAFMRLLPVLVASDHLETLQCSLLRVPDSIDQLAPILSRIRNLSLTFTFSLTPHLFKFIHNSSTLQNLQLSSRGPYNFHPIGLGPVILPELQFLSVNDPSIMTRFVAPKLSSLDVVLISAPGTTTLKCPILDRFDFSSARYLYIRGPQSLPDTCRSEDYCILMSKERTQCKSLFSMATQIIYQDIFAYDYPRDCFHLKTSFDLADRHNRMLRDIFSMISPRATNLVEVHLLFPLTLAIFRDTLTAIPSVEKVVVQRGKNLIPVVRLLGRQTSLCPRLRQLSFKTLLVPRDLERYANDVGKGLRDCIKARRKECTTDQLKLIVLRNCPPLSNDLLEKIQELGTEVVTEKSIQDVIRINNESLDQRYSDVEI